MIDSINPENYTENIEESHLLNLPVELFLKICSFLDAEFISSILSKVCQRFDSILADKMLWRFWVSHRIKGCYPALPRLDIWNKGEIDWKDACVDIDNETNRWQNAEQTMKHIVAKDIHFASVDAILLINAGEMCISGGRDRGLGLWELRYVDESTEIGDGPAFTNCKPTKLNNEAHLGWIWDLTADNIDDAKVIYSASWDNTVKAWDLETKMDLIQTFNCGISVLSVVTIENIIYAGLYSRKVLAFDPRVGSQCVATYKFHKGPVLTMQHNGHLIATASEDRTIAVWDTRTTKLRASEIKLPGEKEYPVCMNWNPTSFYVGDSKGSLHLIDPEKYKIHSSYKIWPEPENLTAAYKITGIYQGLGSLIVSTNQGEIKCLYPSHPPDEFASIKSATNEITKLQYLNGILSVGTCESAVEFWIPNNKQWNKDNF